MKVVLTLVFVTCIAPTYLRGQTVPQAREFLEGIYAWDTNDAADDPLADAKAYSPSLIRLIRLDQRRGHGDIGKLDYEPLCECQDPSGLRYTIKSMVPVGRYKLRAEVTLVNSPTGATWQKNVILDLVWTKQGWRINDTHTAREPSLREFLLKP